MDINLSAKKSLGQHFLKSKKAVLRLTHCLELDSGSTVLEIGPGKGVLTEELLNQGLIVFAIETDPRMVEHLQQTLLLDFPDTLHVIHADFLEYDLGNIPKPFHVVANIPYYITGKILRKTLQTEHQPLSMALLVQKEIAQRISATDKKYSILSNSVQLYGKPKIVQKVPARAFSPKPKVDSAIIKITEIKRPETDEDLFFTLMKQGFSHKRKQLYSNLKDIVTEKIFQTWISRRSINGKVRAEKITVTQWFDLVSLVSTNKTT